jgi:hypothetical protein
MYVVVNPDKLGAIERHLQRAGRARAAHAADNAPPSAT